MNVCPTAACEGCRKLNGRLRNGNRPRVARITRAAGGAAAAFVPGGLTS